MKRLISIIILLTALGSLKAGAWGWDHKLICYVAQNHCTPKTMEVIERYLDAQPASPCSGYLTLPRALSGIPLSLMLWPWLEPGPGLIPHEL